MLIADREPPRRRPERAQHQRHPAGLPRRTAAPGPTPPPPAGDAPSSARCTRPPHRRGQGGQSAHRYHFAHQSPRWHTTNTSRCLAVVISAGQLPWPTTLTLTLPVQRITAIGFAALLGMDAGELPTGGDTQVSVDSAAGSQFLKQLADAHPDCVEAVTDLLQHWQSLGGIPSFGRASEISCFLLLYAYRTGSDRIWPFTIYPLPAVSKSSSSICGADPSSTTRHSVKNSVGACKLPVSRYRNPS